MSLKINTLQQKKQPDHKIILINIYQRYQKDQFIKQQDFSLFMIQISLSSRNYGKLTDKDSLIL
ncbi:hypothetical protein VIAG107301_02130 [Vibrio agarivorans]